MDRSFLLRKEVIDASRDFVCIRLATYEDKDEADYLVKVFPGRTGVLENTVYTMLSPDARKYLTRSGRSPDFAFQDSTEMARQMRAFVAAYEPTAAAQSLPTAKDFRVALNVAACDNMPLVAAVIDPSAGNEQKDALTEKLAGAAWSTDLRGMYAYAPIATVSDLKAAKIPATPGIYVIAPGTYGQTGAILARMPSDATAAELRKALMDALKRFKPPVKEARAHIQQGDNMGVFWRTAIPVTDPNGPPPRRQ